MYVHASMKISMMALGFRIKIPKPFHILISILISSLSLPMLKWRGKINHFANFVYNQGVTEETFSTYKLQVMYLSHNSTCNTYAACCHSLSRCTSKSSISLCKAYFPTLKTPYYHVCSCFSWGKRESRIPLMENLAAQIYMCAWPRALCDWNHAHLKRRSLFRVFLYDHWDRALTVMEGHLAFKCNCSKGESPTSTDKAGGGNPSVNWFEQKLKMATRFTIKVIDFRFKIKRSLSTIWSCLMGKTEDYRQPTTRHFHKKEAHCKVQNHHYVGLQESLSESYMYVGIGTQPEKRTGLWVKQKWRAF